VMVVKERGFESTAWMCLLACCPLIGCTWVCVLTCVFLRALGSDMCVPACTRNCRCANDLLNGVNVEGDLWSHMGMRAIGPAKWVWCQRSLEWSAG
jgi:hypothetical protein